MRPELKKKLDEESKRHSRGLLVAVLFTSIALLAYGLTYFPLSITNVEGEAIGLTAKQTEVGSLPRLRVRLNNERIVRASMTREQISLTGVRVTLEERKTLIGIKRYRVLSYVNTDAIE